jgi:hypothetical protein
MITQSKRPLYAALVGAGILALTGNAEAVRVSGDGRGQVLLYPYYTTRSDSAGNAFATLISVVNGTALAKAVNVKISEGKYSRQVFELNLFLSPFDVWTAAILPNPSTAGARIGTVDRSCSLPAFSASPTAPYYSFVNSAYAGASDDGAGTSLDRTKEGHFEIIEMATYASSSITGKAVTHVNGMPPCGTTLTDVQAAMDAQPPTGGLFGSATLINVNSGTDYSFDAVALANFFQIGSDYNSIGTSLPDLTQAAPPVSAIFAPDGSLYESRWGSGTADAVSAVLMHDSLLNEYTLDSATKSGTDWVVTFPTKRHYVDRGGGNADRVFQRNFNGSVGSCDEVRLNIWDRDERAAQPAPPPTAVCWGANVMTFNNSNVLGSMNAVNLQPPFQNGWMNATFPTSIGGASPNVHRLINTAATTISGGSRAMTTVGNTVTYTGLPMIGFSVTSFANGTLVVGGQNVLSNYGGGFVHKTGTTIQ